MASRKRLAAVAGGAAAAAAAGRRAPSAPVEGAKPPPRDLNDPKTQEQILNPPPAVLTIGGEQITLHVLPALQQRQLAGLCGLIIAEASVGHGAFILRLQAALAESYDLSRRFFGYVARATFPADFVITPEIVQRIEADAARFLATATYREIGPLFDRLTAMNNILEAFTSPK
jgi:hypothetical protein